MAPLPASAEQRVDMPREEFEPAMWRSECCIYEVPEILRKGKPEAYTPQLVSIGPLHHNDEKLKPMEKQKKQYYHYFQARLQDSHQKEALTNFETFIEKKEVDIRGCYSKKCDLSKQEFVEMMLLDSVFIMELFLRESKQEEDLLFRKLWIKNLIKLDLSLLENQIPMFVLVKLYNKVFPDGSNDGFLKLACDYFTDLFKTFQGGHRTEDSNLDTFHRSKHFTDMIRYSTFPSHEVLKKWQQSETPNSVELKIGVTALDAAGITFEKIEKQPLLAIEFKKSYFKSRLRIPQLIVDDGTEILLWNLLALEQCHYPWKAYICSYLDLLDSLIDSKGDVDFLIENAQVIVNNVGRNKQVAIMINSLCKEVRVGWSCYSDIIQKLNEHYNKGWNRNMAKLKSVYFCDLWRGSSTVVGVAVFLFSVFNTAHTFFKGRQGLGNRKEIFREKESAMASAAASAEHKIDIRIEELQLWWPECCIYDVPEILRKEKPEAYTPQLISIGPLHHNEEKMKPMEKQKKLYHHYFQTRLQDSHQKEALKKFKTFLESEENHIRRCYSNKCEDFSKQEFVQMILLDSVFIMELFLRNFTWKQIQSKEDHSNQTEQEKDLLDQFEKDLLFSKLWISGVILRDLLLLENQLPIFVLIELYNNVVPDLVKQGESFHKLACYYFAILVPSLNRDLHEYEIYERSEHFSDLIRYSWFPSDPEHLKPDKPDIAQLKTARKLAEAGITFEKIQNGPLLAVDFQKKKFLNKLPCLSTIPRINVFKSRLRIPQLIVDEGTEILLRNLIALEQCHYPKKAYICNYVAFMDCLIDTKEDVDFFIEKQIIVKNLGSSKEVATLLNSLCKEVHLSLSCYAGIIRDLNRHYNNGWNHSMATLKSVYFCDLWRSSATVVGIAVFFFSVFNTVRTFLKGF
ncbi:hypothetical protein L6164_003575 [Bauhinia variegata]|uniref:Uncharacterized protein n=1 Tax=Bauhinia variegata TaxID=167791 RepID=A0ACB9Q378_BAUVA|nr:hypothetical protein L6164_003575 [Bauhinia variegata]